MSMFLYGNFGSSSANRYLGLASAEVANSAARLSSGMRVVAGSAGGAELTQFQTTKNLALDAAAAARTASDSASKVQRDAALLDNIASLLLQAKELDASGSTEAAYTSQVDALMTAANSLAASISSETGTVTVGTALASLASAITNVGLARGTAAGKAAGYEYTAIAKAAVANIYDEAAQNYIAVDFGAETANLTRNQILQQTASAMVAQANQSANTILALFK